LIEVRECEECGKDIGPDEAYVAIDIASDSPEELIRAVHLHLGDCLAKFRVKQQAEAVKGKIAAKEKTPKREK